MIMRKLTFFLLLSPFLIAAQNWKTTPSAPKFGETIRVEFDLSNSKLRAVENVEINALEYVKDKAASVDIATFRAGDKLTGIFILGPETKSVLLTILNEDDSEQMDNNNGEGGARKLFRFELQVDGTVDFKSQKLIYDWGTTRGPDGMKLDSVGRLYVAAGLNKPNLPSESADPATAGIYVFTVDGELLDFAPIPRDETTNCGFGGPDLKTLFVTAGGSLWQIPTLTSGAKRD